MLRAISSTIQEWATELGGIGLFILAALDSSFLSFPQVNDLLIIYLSTKYPARMPYYAGMTTAGSLIGCYVLDAVAWRGGEAFLRKRMSGARVNRGLELYQRHGLLAVVVPSLLPPPVPFKLFVLLAGAARVSPWKFGLAILVGRGIRYFGQGYLAVLYGERAAEWMREHGAVAGIALAAAIVLFAVIYWYFWRTPAASSAQPARTGDSQSTGAGN
jgi:membrane protein YqaA with SNARE-associated domain